MIFTFFPTNKCHCLQAAVTDKRLSTYFNIMNIIADFLSQYNRDTFLRRYRLPLMGNNVKQKTLLHLPWQFKI